MIPTTPATPAKYAPGARVKVTHAVRVGGVKWTTHVVGTVFREDVRPVGGMEMGMKAACGFQSALVIQGDDGELTAIAIDENTDVQIL